jgi:Gpi18-like mannosyltransferase
VLVVLVLGLGFRLWFSPAKGYEGDIWTFQCWAKSAVRFGVAEAYERRVHGAMLPNYPPLSMLILTATGWFYHLVFSPSFEIDGALYRVVIKLPALLSDVAIAALVYRLLRQKGLPRPWLAAAIYLAHPAALYDSAIWGQMDSLYTAFVMAAFVFFLEKRFALFGALLACAALSKAQTVVFLPLAAVLALTAGWRNVVRATLAGSAVVACVLAPFVWGGVLESVKNAYTGSVGFYPALSSNAYNLWWALYGDRAMTIEDTAATWLHATSRSLGWAMWGLCVAYAIAVVVWRFRSRRVHDGTLIFFAASICAYSFFVLNTEMHERYLFPLVAFGLPVAAAWPRFRGPYAVSTLLYFANMLAVLRWTDVDGRLFETFTALPVLIATLQTACLAVVLRRFAEYAREAPRGEVEAAAVTEPPPSSAPLTSSSVAHQTAAAR